MDEQLKQLVLARAAEIARMVGGYYSANAEWSIRRFKNGKIKLWRYREGSSIEYMINPETPAIEGIWPLAATVLKVKLPALG